ncbi:MAG: PPOX class F420-dependent enzyme, partial [Actinomycetales bacterium]|nr:PPOX class F420-dependent enzyme [Actinomycetales bacterium]
MTSHAPHVLTDAQLEFVRDRHLATLTTLREDGTPHVVPVAFTWDAERGIARVTTHRGSVKARNLASGAG